MNKDAAHLEWIDEIGAKHAFYFDLVVSEKWEQGAEVTEHPVEQGANITDHVRVNLIKCTLEVFATNEPLGANNFSDPGGPSAGLLNERSTPETGSGATDGTLNGGPLTAQVWHNNLALNGALKAIGGGVGGAVGGVAGNAIGVGLGAVTGALLGPGKAVPTSVPVTAGMPTYTIPSTTINVQSFSNPIDFVSNTIQSMLDLKNDVQILSVIGSKQNCDSMVIESISYTRSQEEGTGASISISFKEIRLVQTQQVAIAVPSIPSAAAPVKKGNQDTAQAPPQTSSIIYNLWTATHDSPGGVTPPPMSASALSLFYPSVGPS